MLRIPNGEELGIKLLVDVEAQNDDTPGYDLTERAIFYCGRMLSAQLSTEFTNSTADKVKYGNLKKVYSIWICTDTAHERAGTIERYHLQRTVYPRNREEEVTTMTAYAARLIANGRAEGRTEGRAEGRTQEQIRVIQKMLEMGQNKEFIMKLGYTEAEIEEAARDLMVTV